MAGKSQVYKADPEEQAVIQNIMALAQQLQSLGAGGVSGEPGEPEGDEGMELDPTRLQGARMALKADEPKRTEQPQNVTDPGAKPKDAGMAPWQDGGDEVKKAFATIAKAMQASPTDGPTANDTGEERIEDMPDVDEENIKAVAKMLARMTGKKTVAKSMGSVQAQPDALGAMFSVMKSMSEKLEQQGAVIGELLEGLGVAKSAIQDPGMSQVQKSQNRPYGDLNGGNLEAVIMAVAKGMASGQAQGQSSGIPLAAGFGSSVQKDMGEFVEGFAQISQDRWGRTLDQQ